MEYQIKKEQILQSV
jgi:uncharacterized protein YukE